MLEVPKKIGKKKKLKLAEVKRLFHRFVSLSIFKVQGLLYEPPAPD